MRIHLLAVQFVAFFFEHEHGIEFIRADLFEADANAQLEGGPRIDCTPQQKAMLGVLRRIQLVQRAVITAATIIRRIRAQPGIA